MFFRPRCDTQACADRPLLVGIQRPALRRARDGQDTSELHHLVPQLSCLRPAVPRQPEPNYTPAERSHGALDSGSGPPCGKPSSSTTEAPRATASCTTSFTLKARSEPKIHVSVAPSFTLRSPWKDINLPDANELHLQGGLLVVVCGSSTSETPYLSALVASVLASSHTCRHSLSRKLMCQQPRDCIACFTCACTFPAAAAMLFARSGLF